MKRALVFPGQGSQTVGMGRELAATFPAAQDVFREVDDALSAHLSRIIFEGPEDTLTLTENAQPAIMATSIAVLRVLERETGLNVASYASYVAGHSLGEYSALCAAGTFSLADTARLLRTRGQAMQQAVPPGQGAMAAILGLEFGAVQAIAEQASSVGVCAIANDNSPGQVVISGAVDAVNRAADIAREKGAKRALLLPVSAPFHCALMGPAQQVMQEALAATAMHAPAVPVIANVTAEPVSDVATIRSLLVKQVTGMVRWRESVSVMKGLGVGFALELGAGKVLAGLIRRIEKEMDTVSVSAPADIEQFAKAA